MIVAKKSLGQNFLTDKNILEKLNINLNLRPQNLNYQTYYKLAYEYEKLKS